AETTYGDLVFSPGSRTGVYSNSGGPVQSEDNAVWITNQRCRYISGYETDGTKQTNYYLQTPYPPTATFQISAGQDIVGNTTSAWWTDKVGPYSIGNGWLVWGYGPYRSWNYGYPAAAFGSTYADARNTSGGSGPGIGLARIFDGYFNRGVDTYHAVDS